MTEKREFDPIKVSFPNPEKIKCKDCVFRDKKEITIGSKVIKCGVTKDQCEIFQKPNYKPKSILFQNDECNYYVKDRNYGTGR